MTAQEIYEREGFLLMGCNHPERIGLIVSVDADDEKAPGAIVKIVSEASREEALQYILRNAESYPDNPAKYMIWKHFYKVIAE